MKRTALFVSAIALMGAAGSVFTSCDDKDKETPAVAVTGVTVSPSDTALAVGATFTAKATVQPADATNKEVTWKSSDEAVATVTADGGVVTAKTAGTATITATTKDGGKTASVAVTVNAAEEPPTPVAVTGITITGADTLTVDEKSTYTATVAPNNATNTTVTWSIAPTSVATIDAATGEVTAVAAGTATITATANDGSSVTGTLAITVTAAEPSPAQKATELATALGENASAEGTTVTLTGDVSIAEATVAADVTLVVPEGKTLTVTGALSGAGTLTVAGVADVTTSNFTGAVDLQNGGATNVGFTAPSGAASGLVWKFGSQTWSDLIQLEACDGQFTPNVTVAAGGTFTHNETKRFVYNWYYVNENAGTLCPEGWRVPTKTDADALVSAAGQASFLTDRWGFGGQLNVFGEKDMADVALLYWTSTEVDADTNNAYDLTAVPEWGMFLTNPNLKYLGKQVRCVRE